VEKEALTWARGSMLDRLLQISTLWTCHSEAE
jgi:hypothetical protein